jgi:beta-mannanase
MWPGRDLSELTAFSTSIGGLGSATWSIWSQWGDPATREFPTAIAKGVRDRRATPVIWWEPIDPRDLASPTFARLANIVDGDHDAYIRRFARDARALRSTVIVRFAHEGNGRTFPWGRDSFGNDAPTYVAAWRHVHDLFRQVGARNVRFLWSVSKQGCDGGCNPYTPFYPGDAYVDYLGFSSFNWGALRDEWTPMAQGFRPVWKKLTEVSTRPIIAIETASNGEGGDKAKWILNGYPNVYTEFPSIVAVMYLNVDLRSSGHPDWRLGSPPEALQAYASIAARPEFQGRLPG